jgi:hypothetical protein
MVGETKDGVVLPMFFCSFVLAAARRYFRSFPGWGGALLTGALRGPDSAFDIPQWLPACP